MVKVELILICLALHVTTKSLCIPRVAFAISFFWFTSLHQNSFLRTFFPEHSRIYWDMLNWRHQPLSPCQLLPPKRSKDKCKCSHIICLSCYYPFQNQAALPSVSWPTPHSKRFRDNRSTRTQTEGRGRIRSTLGCLDSRAHLEGRH